MSNTKKNFVIDSVSFPLTTAIKLFKKCERFSKDYLLKYVIDKSEFLNLWDVIPPMNAKEVFELDNAEQRMIAIKYIGMAELLSNFKHKIIDSQTITKQNKRWSINSDGELEERIDTIKDTYELIELAFPVTRNETINITGIKCKCTTTEREYFIYAPPINPEDSVENFKFPKDAIEAIASTFRVNVKPEAVKCIRRQGDVILVVLKPEWEDLDWKCEWRPVSKDEYLTKLESET